MAGPRYTHMHGPRFSDLLEEESVLQQVARYLERIRYTLPFPVGNTECYFGCLPPNMEKWWRDGLFKAKAPLGSRAGNLLLTMNQSSLSARQNILHIAGGSPAAYQRGMAKGEGFDPIFWIEVPPQLPVPRNSVISPFFLPHEHQHHDVIMEWVRKGYEIEQEHALAMEGIRRFEVIVKTPNVAVKVWPELGNFIKTRVGSANNVTKALRERAMDELGKEARESILTQLSRAVMLPEVKTPLTAWVMLYTGAK